MSLKQKVGVCLLAGSLALNSCASSSQIKELENKVSTLEQKITNINSANQIRDVDELYLKMIAPTMMVELELETESKIGAGTVLYSKRNSNTLVYSYVLTAGHVVYTTAKEFSIEVYQYSSSQERRKKYDAEVIAINNSKDLAVLEIISDNELPVGNLIPKNKINEINIFDKVYAVGCPTKDIPMQSYGELTNKMTSPRKKDFWRINAPTAHGNSGGGIFLENTKELIGVLCTGETEEIEHKNKTGGNVPLRDHYIDIPHLSIMTSPDAIYSFLEEENLQFIYDSNFSRDEWSERR